MKKIRPDASVVATDHAVLRWLEREHGLDVMAIRQHLCGKVLSAAQLGAIAIKVDKVRLVLVAQGGEESEVVITTALPRNSSNPGLHGGKNRNGR